MKCGGAVAGLSVHVDLCSAGCILSAAPAVQWLSGSVQLLYLPPVKTLRITPVAAAVQTSGRVSGVSLLRSVAKGYSGEDAGQLCVSVAGFGWTGYLSGLDDGSMMKWHTLEVRVKNKARLILAACLLFLMRRSGTAEEEKLMFLWRYECDFITRIKLVT